ncbi:MAG: cobalt ECF transporter T component CbiQ [Gammaproteobacteria bacterium]|nr:MAG: cobalt ECF transporter T component CbiQ [Pseudomonadota bacterium]PIE38042.1 MAG: cobalt ECF transporter T component CbiQ [Gammaproteobacteria bacterium]
MAKSLEHSGTSWKGQNLKHAESMVDSFDPRVRIVWCAIYACIVVLSNSFVVVLTGFFCSIALVFLAKLNLKRTIRRLLAMDMFMIFLIVLLPFTTPGQAIFHIGGLVASKEGLLHALLIAVKANTVVLALLAMVGTMSTTAFGYALAKLRVPDKLVHLLLFTVRYLDVIGQEYKRMRQAMLARAFVLRPDKHTWRSIGYLVGMLLIYALERSERIMDAMKCRGYQGRFYLLDEVALSTRDYWFVALGAPFCIVLASLNLV